MRNKGFTLVEIVVVLAVISILVSILVPAATKAITNARRNNTAAQMNAIKTAFAAYFADTAARPGSSGVTNPVFPSNVFIRNLAAVTNWNGPYLDKAPNNPSMSGTTQLQREGQILYQAAALFDLTGDGVADTGGVYYQLQVPTAADRQRIDAILDTQAGGGGAWNVSGAVYVFGATNMRFLILPD